MNKEINFNNEEYYFIITEKEHYDMSLNLIDISIFACVCPCIIKKILIL